MIDPDRLRLALDETRAALDKAAARSGRVRGSVELILAGKYVSASEAPALVAAGVTVIGENRLQDLQAKQAIVGDALTYDFIGHLQRRKVRALLPVVRYLHSLDSVELATELNSRADGPLTVLVEVNIGDEPTKGGVVPGDLERFVDTVSEYDRLVIGGLMTLPPFQVDPEDSRPYFTRLRELNGMLASSWSGRHDFNQLSMGTSQDFVVAAEEGATMVRVGRSLIDRSQVS